MEGWNGGRWSSWSGYRRETVSSSRSGTIVSTAYTSSGSRFSTFSVEAAAMHFDSLEIQEELELGIHEEELDCDNMDDREEEENMDDREEAEKEEEEEEETREDSIRRLVKESFSASSLNCSIKRDDDMSVVERWVIASPKDGSSSSAKEMANEARSWIRSLHQIAQTISFTRLHFGDGGTKLPNICEEQAGKHVGVLCIPGPYHLTLVIQETMLKILTFVDILVAWDPNTTPDFLSMGLPPYNKLISLLGVCDVLFEASYKILTQINRSSCAQVRRIECEMTILLSAYEDKLGEAIRSTMDKIRMMSTEDANDSPIPLNPQGSSDIHKVTRSVMTCIRFVLANYASMNSAIHGKYVCHIENIPPLDDLIIEMVSCLQGKLANISQSISDQGMRSLFLLNNLFLIQESQHYYYHGLNHQIEGHMETYLQVSWAPLLSCLFKSGHLRLGKFGFDLDGAAWAIRLLPGRTALLQDRNRSLLSKFESKFQKIYTTQKEWKVPDPLLRRRLRQAITDNIIPCYEEYIMVNKVTDPKINPQELEAMLQELFEG